MADSGGASTELGVYVGGLGNAIGQAALQNQARNEAEQAEARETAKFKEFRGDQLDFMDSGINLRDAIEEGDGLEIVESGIDYFSSGETLADRYDSGLASTRVQQALDAVSSGIGLGQAIDEGDGWFIAGETVDLIRDIDTYLDITYGKNRETYNIGRSGEAALGIGTAAFALVQAIDSDDGWGIAQSTTQLLESIHSFDASLDASPEIIGIWPDDIETAADSLGSTIGTILQGIGSAVGLAANIAPFDDILESGDALNIAYTTASTINNSINTYNAIVVH